MLADWPGCGGVGLGRWRVEVLDWDAQWCVEVLDCWDAGIVCWTGLDWGGLDWDGVLAGRLDWAADHCSSAGMG